MTRRTLLWTLFAVTLIPLGCRSSLEPQTDSPAAAPSTSVAPAPFERLLTVDPDAPPLVSLDTTFLAAPGADQRFELRFSGQGSTGTGTWFLRLRVRPETVIGAPVEITVSVVRHGTQTFFAADFGPDGLAFNAEEPAELELHYSHAAAADLAEEDHIGLYRQEEEGAAWEEIPAEIDLVARSVKADIDGFTRYALAIGR